MNRDYLDHESDVDHEWKLTGGQFGPFKRLPRDECPHCGSHEFGWSVYFIRTGWLPILWFYEMRYSPMLECDGCSYVDLDISYTDGTEDFLNTDFAQETGFAEFHEDRHA